MFSLVDLGAGARNSRVPSGFFGVFSVFLFVVFAGFFVFLLGGLGFA